MPVVLLDSTTLGILTNPANTKNPLQCTSWVKGLTAKGISVAVPAVIDYEHRRKLILNQNPEALEKLRKLGEFTLYAPFEDRTWRKGAELWAWARKTGQQTAHNENIDIDVLLAAQAITLSEDLQDSVVIATENLRHLRRYNVQAEYWRKITVEYCLSLVS